MSTSTLVSTPGSGLANSFCSAAEADQYHFDRPAVGTTWSSATNKIEALLWASKLLNGMFVWEGKPATTTQKLAWPRTGLTDRNGNTLSSSIVPEEIKDATAEFARQLMVEDRAGDSDIETQGLEELRAGPVTLKFADNVVPKVVPDAVVNLIPDHWFETVAGRSSIMVPLGRS